LANLKSQKRPSNDPEINHVANRIRKMYNNHNKLELNHDDKIGNNFWTYCKDIFEINDETLPNFDKETCENYFKGIMSSKNVDRLFDDPVWLKQLSQPQCDFNLQLPTYSEVTKITNKMKSSGSPCPFDQISVILLKNCPILRTFLHRIVCYCWSHQIIPKCWKNGYTILIYKKRDNTDPSNFRPITLQPVLSRILSSLIQNRN